MLISVVCFDFWTLGTSISFVSGGLPPQLRTLLLFSCPETAEIQKTAPHPQKGSYCFFHFLQLLFWILFTEELRVPLGPDLLLSERGNFWKGEREREILPIKRKCNPAATNHSCRSSSPGRVSCCWACAQARPALVRECLQLCNVHPPLSCRKRVRTGPSGG